MTNDDKSNKRRRPSRGSSRKRGGSRPRSAPKVQKWSPADFVVPVEEGKSRFHDFNLPDAMLRAIQDLGYQYCTPIQAATLESALAGKDIIGKAQTGTGKTAAFLTGIITDLIDFPLGEERRMGEPRVLIVAPTRELALQIASDAVDLGKYADISAVALVGGMDYEKQRSELRERPVDILVATPGRLIDFVRSKEVDLYNVEVLVLDEADRMLSMGFIPDVRTIIRQTPRKGEDRQTLLYSATFSDDIMSLAQQWTVDPVRVEIEPDRKTTDNISQTVFLVSSSQKYRLLRNYIRVNGIEKVIVFGNRRHETRALAERLEKDGLRAALMSGEIPQNKRLRTLEDFRSGKIQVLVATDVAGRGIHIDGVTHVINYQLPEDPEDYVHRIGRTGRAGATGASVCFACENDSFLIPEIEVETGVKMNCLHPDPELLLDIMPVAAPVAEETEVAVATDADDAPVQASSEGASEDLSADAQPHAPVDDLAAVPVVQASDEPEQAAEADQIEETAEAGQAADADKVAETQAAQDALKAARLQQADAAVEAAEVAVDAADESGSAPKV
ncbi:ATP-dependent RNA helicase RhlB [Marinobacterium aestuarii]|uniref:ATP-dependent RNA helicase RhlB n=1 Tax=Marinobacterium aestuarii TaxID=1821621 RepID=UPI000A06DBAF